MLENPKVPQKFKELGVHILLDAKVFQKGMKSFGEIGQAHPHKVV
jgi:hypothetical protein